MGGIGFVCFWTVVLMLVPPPTGIHCCLFGHQLRPLTFANGWLIPVNATMGAHVAIPTMLPPSGLKGERQFYKSWSDYRFWGVLLYRCNSRMSTATTNCLKSYLVIQVGRPLKLCKKKLSILSLTTLKYNAESAECCLEQQDSKI